MFILRFVCLFVLALISYISLSCFSFPSPLTFHRVSLLYLLSKSDAFLRLLPQLSHTFNSFLHNQSSDLPGVFLQCFSSSSSFFFNSVLSLVDLNSVLNFCSSFLQFFRRSFTQKIMTGTWVRALLKVFIFLPRGFLKCVLYFVF